MAARADILILILVREVTLDACLLQLIRLGSRWSSHCVLGIPRVSFFGLLNGQRAFLVLILAQDLLKRASHDA